MKKSKILFTVFMGLVALAIVSSCNKDEAKLTNVTENKSVENRSVALNSISVENGIPVFTDPVHYRSCIKALEEATKNASHLASDYLSLGITQTMLQTEGTDYTECPGCKILENAKGFISTFSNEENAIFADLQLGKNTNSIIIDQYRKALMNSNKAYKIGSRYFKEFADGTAVVVGNNNSAAFDAVANLTPNLIVNNFDVRLTSKFENNAGFYYNINLDGLAQSSKDVNQFDYLVSETSQGVYEVKNISFVEYANGTPTVFKWKYSDGQTSVGRNPNRSFQLNQKVDAIFGNDENGWDTIIVDIRGCIKPKINIVPLGGNRFSVFTTESDGNGIVWTFSDGTTASGQRVDKSFPCGQFVKINLAIKYLFRPDCVNDTTVFIVCKCDQVDNNDDDQEYIVGGKTFRLDVKIWVDNSIFAFTTGEVGSRSKSLKKGLLGIFSSIKVTNICTNLNGTYFGNEETCPLVSVGTAPDCETNSGNVQRNISDKGARKNPGQLHSRHSMTINGTLCTYTKNMGKLVLN